MAILTFQTPVGQYCSWDFPTCIAYDNKGICKFFNEHLTYDGTAHVRCEQCQNLKKYGTSKQPIKTYSLSSINNFDD